MQMIVENRQSDAQIVATCIQVTALVIKQLMTYDKKWKDLPTELIKCKYAAIKALNEQVNY